MRTQELARRINHMMLEHSAEILMSGRVHTVSPQALNEERVSRATLLIEQEYPTVPLPEARMEAADPYRASISITTAAMLFMIESMLDGHKSPAEIDAHNEKFRGKIQSSLDTFKRAIRDEAMAEFTESSATADQLMEGTIGKRQHE